MTLLEYITGGAAVISALFGGGAAMRYNRSIGEKAVMEYRLEQAETKLEKVTQEITKVAKDNATVKAQLANIVKQFENLQMIPAIAAKLEALNNTVERLQDLVNDLATHRGE